jgi:uncharacterized protein YkwD
MPGSAGSRWRLLAAALVALCALAIPPAPASAGADHWAVYALPYRVASAPPRADLESRVLDLVNRERIDQGVAPLLPHAGLRSAARAHGVEMFARGFLSHRSRDGRTPAQRVLGQQIRARLIGENIAYAADVETAHAALMDSDSHRSNILSPLFRLAGVAVIDGGARGVLVVEDFADGPSDLAARGRSPAR